MAAVSLASCGGGTSQIEPFVATRYIALGDEMSVLTSAGLKYSTNALNSDKTAVDCKLNPLWIQRVAGIYGFGFTECPVGTGDQKALTRATVGATAADLLAQVDAQVAAGGFTERDLVTVLVGVNDIKELYGRYPAESEAALSAIAGDRGSAVAGQVNRLISLGAKVVIATVPDVGLTPYGKAQGTANAALISRLSAALNSRIRVGILNDGRFVGLVLADELVQTAVRAPSIFGLTNATTAACSVALPDCTTDTLATGASADTWLWADDLRFAAGGHRRLGDLAESRARNNPF
jgi:outer membrane lipase/esterase